MDLRGGHMSHFPPTTLEVEGGLTLICGSGQNGGEVEEVSQSGVGYHGLPEDGRFVVSD